MFSVLVVSILVVTTVSISHFLVLKWLSGGMARIRMSATIRILVIVLVVTVAHVIEVLVYAKTA